MKSRGAAAGEKAMRKKYDFSKAVRGKHFDAYRDNQLTELSGKHLLIAQLTRGGLEVAVPVRDWGIDLIAYLDKPPAGSFVACPIQLKASSHQSFGLHAKYRTFPNLIIAYVWNVIDPVHSTIYAMTYQEALEILEDHEHVANASWQDHSNYYISKPSKQLTQDMEKYEMTPQKWLQKVSSVLHGNSAVVTA